MGCVSGETGPPVLEVSVRPEPAEGFDAAPASTWWVPDGTAPDGSSQGRFAVVEVGAWTISVAGEPVVWLWWGEPCAWEQVGNRLPELVDAVAGLHPAPDGDVPPHGCGDSHSDSERIACLAAALAGLEEFAPRVLLVMAADTPQSTRRAVAYSLGQAGVRVDRLAGHEAGGWWSPRLRWPLDAPVSLTPGLHPVIAPLSQPTVEH